MVRQYFTDIELEPEITLSEALQSLVDSAAERFESDYVEVTHVIRHDIKSFTVILNVDATDEAAEDEGGAAAEQEESGTAQT